MNEEVTYDTDEDILFQIAMITYERHNSNIASINDHLGEIYSYKDLEDAERCELEDEKHLLELAVKQLQQENQQLKDQIDNMKKPQLFIDTCDMEERYGYGLENDYLREKLKQRDEVIDEAIKFIKENSKQCLANIENNTSIIGNFMWHSYKLLDILQKYKGGNHE